MAINLPITSTFDDSGLNKAQKALAGLGGPAGKLGNILKASVVPGLVAAAGSVLVFTKGLLPAIQAASDLQENTSKIEVIFGDAGRAVTDFAKTAARDIGQSQNQVLAAAGTFGTFGKAAGLAGDQLATFTNDFITLSADLASFNNATPDEAINAIGAALRGEAEPLRRFGVLLNDATLKSAALELGIYSGSGALTAQQKILAAQKVIYEQTGDAQGDFERTSDGLANQQRILSAQFENVKTKIGELLIPAFSALVKFLNDEVLPAVDRVITAFGEQGLGAGLRQAVAETGSAGEGLVKAFKLIAVNAARMANVVYKSVQVLIAQFQFVTGSPLDAIKTMSKVFDEFIDIGALSKSFDTFAYKVSVLQGAVLSQNQTILDAEARLDSFGKKAKKVASELAGDDDDETTLSGAAKKVSEAVKEAADALNKEMAQALEGARNQVEKAKRAFDDYANSVADVIRTALDFGAAFEEGGEDAGSTFFSALQKQADKAKEFASLVEQLLASGLSQEALQQVIDAGIDSGSAIAKELLQSSENVLRANKLVEETNKIAEQIGILSANKFYAAGVSNAQQYLAGVEAAMAVAQARLGKKGINLADVKGISSGFNNAISTTPTMTAPTMPSVIPVGAPTDKGRPLGNVTINVASQLATKGEVGEAVNDALRAYNRLSGPLQLQIA
jgi:DNA-binding ferritin-like protein